MAGSRADDLRPDPRIPLHGWAALTWLLRVFLRPYAWSVGVICVLLLAQVAESLYLPNLNADIINNGIATGDVGYIWRAGILMLGLVIGITVVAVVAVYLTSRVSMGVGAGIRTAIYQRVQAFSARELDRFGISSLVTRTINDVQQIQVFVQTMLRLMLIAIFTSIGAIILSVKEGPGLSVLVAVGFPVVALGTGVTLVMLLPLMRSVQIMTDRINQVLREQITGVRVIRAFTRGRTEEDRFEEANADITQTTLRITQLVAISAPFASTVTALSSVGVLWFGGRFVSEGSMTIGNLSAFLAYIQVVFVYVLIAIVTVIPVPRAVACAERIAQVIGAAPAIADPSRPVTPATVTGAVEFSHVTFGYPGSERPVLHDLSFRLKPGQTTAIVGGTGSGKTTVLKVIMRLLAATDGTVLVNGDDVREQAAERLWAEIGMVPQSAFLFAGTVASNLRFGMPDATDDQLWHALDVAQAVDFVASMPAQLNAQIDQGGSNVSGGQRQRLSIARALVRRPRLYLFDDCFSALDVTTDARLRAALQAETQEATVVIVAQRVSTIMHADQIIVLDAGEIAGIGTHQQLLDGSGTYREIVASQLGEGAVA